MSVERILRVDKTVIEVFVGRNLHIYDRDQDGTSTVINAIDDNYLSHLLEWVGEVPFDNIYLYHTDGMITEWSHEHGFKRVREEDPELYYPFVERCVERRKQFQFVH